MFFCGLVFLILIESSLAINDDGIYRETINGQYASSGTTFTRSIDLYYPVIANTYESAKIEILSPGKAPAEYSITISNSNNSEDDIFLFADFIEYHDLLVNKTTGIVNQTFVLIDKKDPVLIMKPGSSIYKHYFDDFNCDDCVEYGDFEFNLNNSIGNAIIEFEYTIIEGHTSNFFSNFNFSWAVIGIVPYILFRRKIIKF